MTISRDHAPELYEQVFLKMLCRLLLLILYIIQWLVSDNFFLIET
jgi:hypothetical protein